MAQPLAKHGPRRQRPLSILCLAAPRRRAARTCRASICSHGIESAYKQFNSALDLLVELKNSFVPQAILLLCPQRVWPPKLYLTEATRLRLRSVKRTGPLRPTKSWR